MGPKPKTSRIFANFFRRMPEAESKALVESAFHFVETEVCGGGDVIVDAGQYPVLWAFAALDKKTNGLDENYPQWVNLDADFADFADIFLSQLRTDGQKNELIKNTCELTFSMLAHKGSETSLTDSIAKVVAEHRFQDYYQFCDLVLGFGPITVSLSSDL